MATATMTEETAPTAEEALETARATVHDLEHALAALPQEYIVAAKRADAAAMRAIRHRRVDAEISLHAARVRAVRAELASLSAAAAEVRNREGDIQREIVRTEAALVDARLHFDEAARARDVAENAASSLRWEQQAARAAILAAQDRLGVLTSQPMPD